MKLDFTVGTTASLEGIDSQAIVILIPEGAKKATALKGISAELYSHIESAINDGDFKPSTGSCLLLRRLTVLKAPRLLLIGIGKGLQKDLKEAMGCMATALKKYEVENATLSLEMMSEVNEQQVITIVTEITAASYEYQFTKGKLERKEGKAKIAKDLDFVLIGADTDVLKRGVKQGQGIAKGVALTRELGNRPSNYITPTYLAKTADDLSKEYKNISAKSLDFKEVEKLGMGAFTAVAKGSAEPLKFIILEYKGGANEEAPIALVGKGITFDSGGISIKPGAGMDEMKFDMCGAASVLGTFAVLGELQPKINVVGLIASCENMPSGTAIKPGDVITSMSGQTIEVLNTDAEGRLVLCDALTYAEQFKPQAVVDIATLTGACVIALGGVNSGLFGNDKTLQDELIKAGEQAADFCWPMPMNEEYDEQLKSNFADMANIGGREAGSVTAAMFLQRYATKYKWAHLDIAGTAWLSGSKKGATGRPVPLLVNFILNRVKG